MGTQDFNQQLTSLQDNLKNGNHNAFDELITKIIQFLSVKVDKSFFRVVSANNFLENEPVIFDASEIGAWRIEIVLAEESAEHRFLTIMATMDQGREPPPVEPISAQDAWGARVLNRAVIFRSETAADQPLRFVVPGTGSVEMLVCSLMPGEWTATSPDGKRTAHTVSEDARSLYLPCLPGRWEFSQAGR